MGEVKPNNKSPKLVPRGYRQRSLNQGEPPQAGQKSEAVNNGSMVVTPKAAPAHFYSITSSQNRSYVEARGGNCFLVM